VGWSSTHGTREVYRNLWETELNISAEIVALLSRKYRLTDMRPGERQALFATVTGVDVSYGFTVYDKLKRKPFGERGDQGKPQRALQAHLVTRG
jgi:hypothetical protein